MTSYWHPIVHNMALSGVVSEIQHNIGADSLFSPTLRYLTPCGGESLQNFLEVFGVEKPE